MTNAIRLYRTYILSENVPMNTNRRGFGLFEPLQNRWSWVQVLLPLPKSCMNLQDFFFFMHIFSIIYKKFSVFSGITNMITTHVCLEHWLRFHPFQNRPNRSVCYIIISASTKNNLRFNNVLRSIKYGIINYKFLDS